MGKQYRSLPLRRQLRRNLRSAGFGLCRRKRRRLVLCSSRSRRRWFGPCLLLLLCRCRSGGRTCRCLGRRCCYRLASSLRARPWL